MDLGLLPAFVFLLVFVAIGLVSYGALALTKKKRSERDDSEE